MVSQAMKTASVSWSSISGPSLRRTTPASCLYTRPPHRATKTSFRSHLRVCRGDAHCFSLFYWHQDRSRCDFICSTASPEDAKHRETHGGKTALFLAVEKGLLDNACFLLDNVSSPDSLDKEEDSPLVVGQTRSSIGVRNCEYIYL